MKGSYTLINSSMTSKKKAKESCVSKTNSENVNVPKTFVVTEQQMSDVLRAFSPDSIVNILTGGDSSSLSSNPNSPKAISIAKKLSNSEPVNDGNFIRKFPFLKSVNQQEPEFVNKLIDISRKLQIEPKLLLAVLVNESGTNINPRATNEIGAAGILQFIPSTARMLGTSTGALLNMNRTQQLDYVYKYFKPHAGKINRIGDIAVLGYVPSYFGQPDGYVVSRRGGSIYNANPHLDVNRDGIITIGDIKRSFENTSRPEVRSILSA